MKEHIGFGEVERSMRGPFYSAGMRLFIAFYRERYYVLEDSCKHRSGPLSLGTIDMEKGTITCPWHELKSCVKSLVKSAIPSIRMGERIEFKVTKGTNGASLS